MRNYKDAIERLARAKGQDRELDLAITLFLSVPDKYGHPVPEDAKICSDRTPSSFWVAGKEMGFVDSFTSSIDSALMLMVRMLPGWDFSLDRTEECLYFALSPAGSEDWAVEVNGPTAPLAILIGVLRALEMSEVHNDRLAS
jgi:hypothetical protein